MTMRALQPVVPLTPTLNLNAAFTPQSKKELETAVEACNKPSPVGNCSAYLHGPMEPSEYVSSVTKTAKRFSGTSLEYNSGAEHAGKSTMRAISYSRWGSPDVLEMVDVPVPDFGWST